MGAWHVPALSHRGSRAQGPQVHSLLDKLSWTSALTSSSLVFPICQGGCKTCLAGMATRHLQSVSDWEQAVARFTSQKLGRRGSGVH